MCKILGGVETGGVSVPPSKGSIEILVYKGGGCRFWYEGYGSILKNVKKIQKT